MSRRVVIHGAGGHAKVCIEVLRGGGYEVVGCVAPSSASESVLGAPVLDAGAASALRRDRIAAAFVAIGANEARARVGRELLADGFTLINAVSPSAQVSPTARLGRGVLVMPGAVVNADAEISDFAIVNTNAVVEHDCRVGVAAHVAPGAVLAGGASLGDGAFVGAGAAVIPHVALGAGARAGAGAAVIRDVAAGATVVGVPGRSTGGS